jgi:hypothetical protein
MPEAEVPEGSVPSMLQARHRASTPVSQPYPLVNRIALGIATALLWAGLLVGALIWGIDSDGLQFRPSSPSSFIARLSCVSIEDVKYDAREYSDSKLTEAVVDALGIKTVLFKADYEACPWALFLAVALKEEPASRRDRSAVYAVSSRICARSTDGAAKPDDCLTRNINIVTWHAVPHDLFAGGLQALTLRQIGASP